MSGIQMTRKNGVLLIVLTVVIIMGTLYFTSREQSIKGFHFYGPTVEQRIISMTADRMVVQKDFFSFGSSPTVSLENGYIDVYCIQTNASTNAFKFGDIFSAETLASFPVKNLTNIYTKPITIRINESNSIHTQLFATSATFRIKERDILLKGDVRVLSEPYLLTTDQLIFSPDTGSFKIDKHYVLRTSDKRFEGDLLTTDIFLRPLNPAKN